MSNTPERCLCFNSSLRRKQTVASIIIAVATVEVTAVLTAAYRINIVGVAFYCMY